MKQCTLRLKKLQIRLLEYLDIKDTSLFLAHLTTVYCCSQLSEGYLPGRLVPPWRHKFRGNQSTFVLLHKACLEGYGNITMMLSMQRVPPTFLCRYVCFSSQRLCSVFWIRDIRQFCFGSSTATFIVNCFYIQMILVLIFFLSNRDMIRQ